MTYRVDGIREETPERFLEISEELAKERDIESGRWVRVTSRHGSLVIKVLVTTRVFGKQVYLPLFLAGGADQYPDRLACGCCHQYSCIQGDSGEDQGSCRNRAQTLSSR